MWGARPRRCSHILKRFQPSGFVSSVRKWLQCFGEDNENTAFRRRVADTDAAQDRGLERAPAREFREPKCPVREYTTRRFAARTGAAVSHEHEAEVKDSAHRCRANPQNTQRGRHIANYEKVAHRISSEASIRIPRAIDDRGRIRLLARTVAAKPTAPLLDCQPQRLSRAQPGCAVTSQPYNRRNARPEGAGRVSTLSANPPGVGAPPPHRYEAATESLSTQRRDARRRSAVASDQRHNSGLSGGSFMRRSTTCRPPLRRPIDPRVRNDLFAFRRLGRRP